MKVVQGGRKAWSAALPCSGEGGWDHLGAAACFAWDSWGLGCMLSSGH